MTQEIVQREPTIGEILMTAVTEKVDVGTLERLVALQEKVAAQRAAQEFNRALADFQEECPSIRKTKAVDYVSKKTGVRTHYDFADLNEVAKTIRPVLHKHGFSYTFDQKVVDGQVECTCILQHANGHERRSSFPVPIDRDAFMSEAQKAAAALTFARRYALTSALGLATCDPDDDGATAGVAGDLQMVNTDQCLHLENLIAEVGANPTLFLKYMGVDGLQHIPAGEYDRAVAALEQKRRKAAAK